MWYKIIDALDYTYQAIRNIFIGLFRIVIEVFRLLFVFGTWLVAFLLRLARILKALLIVFAFSVSIYVCYLFFFTPFLHSLGR